MCIVNAVKPVKVDHLRFERKVVKLDNLEKWSTLTAGFFKHLVFGGQARGTTCAFRTIA